MKVNFVQHGDFSHLEKFLTKSLHLKFLIKPILHKYGEKGVAALRAATPKDTGKTADSWIYDIVEDEKGRYQIIWSNTNKNNNVNIAILLQYGHATKNGGFVKGIDYINPAIGEIFQGMANEAWEEVRQHGNND